MKFYHSFAHLLVPSLSLSLSLSLCLSLTHSIYPPLQTFTSTGSNLTLQFCPTGLSDDKSPEVHPSRDSVNFEREPNRVHMQAKFIMNGVCVKWIGWIDLETLNGTAKLIFDEEQAKVIN